MAFGYIDGSNMKATTPPRELLLLLDIQRRMQSNLEETLSTLPPPRQLHIKAAQGHK
jgi:hypothetical protein